MFGQLPTTKSPVLYFGLEDGERRLQERQRVVYRLGLVKVFVVTEGATLRAGTLPVIYAPERPGMSIPSENYPSISQGHDWGNGCIGKAGNFIVLGTVLVRFKCHSHEIGEVAVVLNGYAVRRCR